MPNITSMTTSIHLYPALRAEISGNARLRGVVKQDRNKIIEMMMSHHTLNGSLG